MSKESMSETNLCAYPGCGLNENHANHSYYKFHQFVPSELCEHECGVEVSHKTCVCAICGESYPNPGQ
jgi:hypothetical protein